MNSRSSTTLLSVTTITWRCYRIPKFSLDGETLTEEGRCFDPELKETRERRANVTGRGSHDSSNGASAALRSDYGSYSISCLWHVLTPPRSVSTFKNTTCSCSLYCISPVTTSVTKCMTALILCCRFFFFYFVSHNSRDLILQRALHKWICSTSDSNVL